MKRIFRACAWFLIWIVVLGSANNQKNGRYIDAKNPDDDECSASVALSDVGKDVYELLCVVVIATSKLQIDLNFKYSAFELVD